MSARQRWRTRAINELLREGVTRVPPAYVATVVQTALEELGIETTTTQYRKRWTRIQRVRP